MLEKSVGVQAMDSEWSNDLVTHWEDPHFMGNQELTIYYIWDQDLLKGTQQQFLSKRIKNTF